MAMALCSKLIEAVDSAMRLRLDHTYHIGCSLSMSTTASGWERIRNREASEDCGEEDSGAHLEMSAK